VGFEASDVDLIFNHDPAATYLPTVNDRFDDITKLSQEALLVLVQQELRCTKAPRIKIHTHQWWRECAQGMHARQLAITPAQHRMQIPLLTPCDDPDSLASDRDAGRPVLHMAPQLERPHQPFGGLTPLPRAYLRARSDEQREFVLSSDRETLLTHTYRTRRMRLFTSPYMSAQDTGLPLSSLRIPELSEWQGKLHGPLNFSVAYPVNDVALRYLEELQRLQMYQISHREQSLANLDYDLQQLVNIIGAMCPNFLPDARQIAKNALARQWAFLRDDTATVAEQLVTTVHQRRQGLLCLGTDKLSLTQRLDVLARPLLGESRIIQLCDRPHSTANLALLAAAAGQSSQADKQLSGDDDDDDEDEEETDDEEEANKSGTETSSPPKQAKSDPAGAT